MAQQIHKSDDFLHCFICMKRFQEPLMLACLHSFCFDCLKKYESKVEGKKLSCPICRRSAELSNEGVEGLPRNYFIINLVDRLELAEKYQKNASAKCNKCQEKLGELFCLDCKVYICSKCKNSHSQTRGADNHVTIASEKLANEEYLKQVTSKSAPRCDEHHDKKLRFYCKECRKLVCSECTKGFHRGHEYGKAESEAKYAKEYLSEILEDGEEEMQEGLELFESLETAVEKVEAQATKMLEKVDFQFNKCIEKLKSDRKELRKKIENRKDKKCKSIEKMKTELNDMLQALKNIDEVTRRVLEGNNPWEVLRMENDIVKSFETIEKDRETLCEEEDQSDIASLDFHSDSSCDDSDSSGDDDSDSCKDGKGSGSGTIGKMGQGNKKSNVANGGASFRVTIIDPDTHIGIIFKPSRIKPPDQLGEILVGYNTDWRNRNHVGKIVRSGKSNKLASLKED